MITMEINEKQEKKKKKATSFLGNKLQSVNPEKSGLAIPTIWNAMDSQEWVDSD